MIDTHTKIRRVLERHRIGPRELGGVGVGELAELIEEALDLRAMNEPCGYCSGLGFHSDADPYPCPHCDSAELRAYAETIIRATMFYCWSNWYDPTNPPFDAIIDAVEGHERELGN